MQSLPVFVNQKKLPGILITGDTTRKTQQDIENKGFNLLEKPVDPEELLEKVAEIAGAGDCTLRTLKCLRRPGGSEDIH